MLVSPVIRQLVTVPQFWLPPFHETWKWSRVPPCRSPWVQASSTVRETSDRAVRPVGASGVPLTINLTWPVTCRDASPVASDAV